MSLPLMRDGRQARAAVFAFSRRGMDVARQVMELPAQWRAFVPERLAEGDFAPIYPPLADFAGPVFQWADVMIFVSSCGIAVRAVAPHVRDKAADPAVVAIDETARFAVSLLSGHIGGSELAAHLEALPVVTTATDVNNRFAVDAWAAEQGLHLGSRAAAKAVSAAILEGPVPLRSDFPIVGDLPPGVISGERGPVGICVSWRQGGPFGVSLALSPKVVRLGIGCRRGTAREVIREAVSSVLEDWDICPQAVKCVCSIDLKRDEPGLLDFCREQGWPAVFYAAGELAAVEGDFTPSAFVRSVTGVDNVCERAALLGAEKLIVRKTARNGVTVAAAVEHWEVRFG